MSTWALSLHVTRSVARDATQTTDRTDPDSDVVDLVLSGDVATPLQLLMERHGAGVYRYCRSVLRDAVLADDVHQQVFMAVFAGLPRFAQRSTLRVWLYSIARHRVLDAAKARRRARARFEDGAAVDVADLRPSAEEVIDDAQLHEIVTSCVDELDPPVRTAVLLRYQQGFTFDEMAEICGEKPGTLATRVGRAVRLLRQRVGHRLVGTQSEERSPR